MPKVRLLAPWTNDKGEPQAQGAVIDVSDEQARDLNGRGAATLVEEEEKLAKQQEEEGGHYSDRAERPGSGGQQAPRQPDPDPKPSEGQDKKK